MAEDAASLEATGRKGVTQWEVADEVQRKEVSAVQ
jgi:hypothetical protein